MKPDRFDKLVAQCNQHSTLFGQAITVGVAARLLRRQHRAVIRLVRKIPFTTVVDAETDLHHDLIDRDDLLAVLTKE